MSVEVERILLTEENAEEFLDSKTRTVKALLFTKKSETPGLWVRLSEAWAHDVAFGEVRHVQTALMERFGMSTDSLPKVLAVLATPDGKQTLTYEGPTDFEHLSEFLKDAGQGGPLVFQLRKELDEKRREIKGLKLEIGQQEEALTNARAEIARVKVGQFGSVEAVKRALEAELKESKRREEDTALKLDQERELWEEKFRALQQENQALQQKLDAVQDMDAERVIFLNDANVDTFFSSRARPLKGVLYTTKPDIPQLWQQLAEAQAMTTAFAVVKHSEANLMTKFNLTVEDLPRICLFREDVAEPVVYDGEVDLQCLSSFFKDAVEGGEAVLAMKQQVHSAVREVEELTEQLEKTKAEAEAHQEEADQRQRTMQYEHELALTGLRTALADAREEGERMLLSIRQDAEHRSEVAESELQGLRTLLHQERTQAQKLLQETLAQRDAEIARERDAWLSAQRFSEMMELELKKVENISKTCEKQLLRAASSVHVNLTRTAREKEKMQASLREFIDDVAPSQVTVAYDRDSVAKAVRSSDSDGIIETIAKGYKSMKDKLKVLEVPVATADASDKDTEFMSSYAASKAQVQRSQDASSASDSASIDSEQNPTSRPHGDTGFSKSRVHANHDWSVFGDLTEKQNLERAKRKQLRDEVTVLGYEGITIGQMTKESERTEDKNKFLWRGKTFLLVYNGKYRDKLIDVESGTTAYQYPLELEVARIKMKEKRSGNFETGTNPDTVASLESPEQSPATADETTTFGVETPSEVGSKIAESGSKDSEGSKTKLSLGRLFFSSSKKEAAPPDDSIGSRQINRNPAGEKDRMPALVNGVLVLAPAQPSEGSRPVSKTKAEDTTQRWSPRSGTSEEEESPRETTVSSRALPSSRRNEESYGAWGSAPSAKGSSRALPPPSIWSDDEDEVVSSTQLFQGK